MTADLHEFRRPSLGDPLARRIAAARQLQDYYLDSERHCWRRRQPDEPIPLVPRLPPPPVGMRPLRLRWWLLLAVVAGAIALGVAL